MITIFDVETTISNKGNPFDQTNKLCYAGFKTGNQTHLFDVEYSDSPCDVDSIQDILRNSVLLWGLILSLTYLG